MEIVSAKEDLKNEDVFDIYQFECILLWNGCLNNHSEFTKYVASMFVTYTDGEEGKYFINFERCKGGEEKLRAYDNIIVLLSKFYLRDKKYLKEEERDKKLRGKLTKILKIENKRRRSS